MVFLWFYCNVVAVLVRPVSCCISKKQVKMSVASFKYKHFAVRACRISKSSFWISQSRNSNVVQATGKLSVNILPEKLLF